MLSCTVIILRNQLSKFRRNGTYVIFVRRNGIRQNGNGLRRDGLTPRIQARIQLWGQRGGCLSYASQTHFRQVRLYTMKLRDHWSAVWVHAGSLVPSPPRRPPQLSSLACSTSCALLILQAMMAVVEDWERGQVQLEVTCSQREMALKPMLPFLFPLLFAVKPADSQGMNLFLVLCRQLMDCRMYSSFRLCIYGTNHQWPNDACPNHDNKNITLPVTVHQHQIMLLVFNPQEQHI